MGARNYKMVKGHKYLYYVISEKGDRRVLYCGPVSVLDTERKALEFEVADLKMQKRNISEKLDATNVKLRETKLELGVIKHD